MFSKLTPKSTQSALRTSVAAIIGAGVLSAGSASALTINFDEGLAGTPGDGTRITNQYKADYGVTFKREGTNKQNGLVLYDTECISRTINGQTSTSSNGFTDTCTGGDEDLATGRGRYGISSYHKSVLESIGSPQANHARYKYDTPEQGNVLILQEGSGNTPDDDANGGRVSLKFNTKANSSDLSFVNGITLQKFGFLDLDEEVIRDAKLSFLVDYLDDDREDLRIDETNYEQYIVQTLLSTDWAGNDLEGDNSLREYTFNNENGAFDAIKRIKVEYHQISGAIAYVEYDETPSAEVPEPGMVMGLGAFALGAFKLRRRKDEELNDGE